MDRLWQRRGASEQKTDALHCCISTPMILGDYLYGVDSYGELRCLDLKTGDRIWEDLTAVPKARWSNIHMVRNGDKVWMFNERGELIISRLAPDGFHEISRAKLIDPTDGPTRPARRRLLVPPGLRQPARLRPQRQGTGLRRSGRQAVMTLSSPPTELRGSDALGV